GVSQLARHIERWSYRTDDHLLRGLTQNDCPCYQDIVACLDQTARGDISQLRIHRPVQIVCFYYPYPSAAVRSADDRSVSRRVSRQGSHDRRFQWVRGRDGAI